MNVSNEDFVSGLAVVLLAVVTAWLAKDFGTGAAGATLKPSFFPLLCAAGLAICGGVLMLRGLRAEGRMPALADRRFAVVAGMLVIELWFFASIDFRFAAWAFTLITMLAFDMRRPVLLAVYPVAVAAILYLGFARGFGVVLPTWI